MAFIKVIYFIMSGVEHFQFELTYPPGEEPIQSEDDEGEDSPEACTSSMNTNGAFAVSAFQCRQPTNAIAAKSSRS